MFLEKHFYFLKSKQVNIWRVQLSGTLYYIPIPKKNFQEYRHLKWRPQFVGNVTQSKENIETRVHNHARFIFSNNYLKTFLCLSQDRSWISNVICRVQWCYVRTRVDCSLCWYWWNCWPSLFKLSFHNNSKTYCS